ncbi:hypothetical protein V6N13_148817 [Hibiscus sabdariffa]
MPSCLVFLDYVVMTWGKKFIQISTLVGVMKEDVKLDLRGLICVIALWTSWKTLIWQVDVYIANKEKHRALSSSFGSIVGNSVVSGNSTSMREAVEDTVSTSVGNRGKNILVSTDHKNKVKRVFDGYPVVGDQFSKKTKTGECSLDVSPISRGSKDSIELAEAVGQSHREPL